MHPLEGVVALVAIITGGCTAFGITYLLITSRNRERLAMIRQGMEPWKSAHVGAGRNFLKWGLVLLALGTGIFSANFLDNIGLIDEEPGIPALMLMFSGLALLAYYKISNSERGF